MPALVNLARMLAVCVVAILRAPFLAGPADAWKRPVKSILGLWPPTYCGPVNGLAQIGCVLALVVSQVKERRRSKSFIDENEGLERPGRRPAAELPRADEAYVGTWPPTEVMAADAGRRDVRGLKARRAP